MAKCPYCNLEFTAKNNICPNCGAVVETGDYVEVKNNFICERCHKIINDTPCEFDTSKKVHRGKTNHIEKVLTAKLFKGNINTINQNK